MTDRPLVSVITATYQMGEYVAQAIDSVLAQDYPNIECIVVDDGSTDRTRDVLARYAKDPRVTVIHQENAGQTVAKNRGLAAANGEIIGFCDADNRWLPGKLARQIPILLKDARIGVVYGDIALIDGQNNPLPPNRTRRYSGKITAKLLISNFVTFNTTLIPRRVIDEVGGFDERLRMAIDYNLWLQISVKYRFHYIDEPLVAYRIWDGQMSHRTGERMNNFFRLLDEFLKANPEAVTASEARHAWAHSLATRGQWLASVQRRDEAWQDYWRSLGYRPYDQRTWKNIIKLLFRR